MEITRHEKDGILQGFSFQTKTPVTLIVHDDEFYYSINKYYGNCDVGVASQNVRAVAFDNDEDVVDFILNNNLKQFMKTSKEWHDNNCDFRLFMLNENYVDMLVSDDGASIFNKFQQAGLHIEKGDGGRYIYYNFLFDEDRIILERFGGLFEPKSLIIQ